MRSTSLRLLVSTVALAGVLGACANLPKPRPTSGDPTQFSLSTDGGGLTARATGSAEDGSLIGPNVQVQWDENTMTGQAFGRAVSLALEENKVRGIYGTQPVRLTVEQGEDVMVARGLFGGQLSRLEVSTNALEGTIGQCSYDLAEYDGVYQGFRQCRGTSEPAWVEIPRSMTTLPPNRLAASLGILLGTAG